MYVKLLKDEIIPVHKAKKNNEYFKTLQKFSSNTITTKRLRLKSNRKYMGSNINPTWDIEKVQK